MPTRRKTEQYWESIHFEKLKTAPPGKLYSKGQLPWRLLAYLLEISPDVERLRAVVRKRLMDAPRIEAGQKALTRMLVTLWAGGYVRLDPPATRAGGRKDQCRSSTARADRPAAEPKIAWILWLALDRRPVVELPPAGPKSTRQSDDGPGENSTRKGPRSGREIYQPRFAYPTPELDSLLVFRSVNPLYGAFPRQASGDRRSRRTSAGTRKRAGSADVDLYETSVCRG